MYYAFIMTVKTWILLYAGTTIFAKLLRKDDAAWVKGKPLCIMMAYYAVGMFGHNYWVAYIMMIGTLPLLAKSRAEAASLFMIAAASITDLSNPLNVGGTYLLYLDKWICLSIGFTFVLALKPRVGPRTATRFDLPFLIMLALELTQARNLNFTATSRIVLGVLLSEGLPFLALVLSIGRLRDLRRVMLALSYLGFILSIVAVYEAFTKQFVYLPINSQLQSGGVALYQMNKIRGGIMRAPTSFADASNFAQFLVVALMATLAYRPFFRSTRMLGVALAIMSLGIFVTSTRTAWIGLLISVLAFDLYRRRYVSLVGKGTALGIIYGSLLLLAEFVPYFATMLGRSGDTSSTSDYRSLLLTRGIQEFYKHPLSGADIATIFASMQDMTQGEGIIDFVNGYLFYALTAGTGGLIGLVLVFLLPCFAMLNIRRAVRRQHVFVERACAFVFAIAANYLICASLGGFGGRASEYFYATLAIGAVLFSWRRIPPKALSTWDQMPGDKHAPISAPAVEEESALFTRLHPQAD